ncbi:unnamed protein product [Mytilus edulis]|uniref:PiggyBac transposable element-derived protein domain-containing protein n=1 Tax=Mytilus edulis TaxID=6550 RepID=A0A8S3R5X3_MYTED|nr:unnamed protein product [Mytilus edulis]
MSEQNSLYSDEGSDDNELSSGDEWLENYNAEVDHGSPDNTPVVSDEEANDEDDAAPENAELVWRETYEELDIDPFIQITGPSHNLNPNASELEYFKLFFDDNMLEKINAPRMQTGQFVGRQTDNMVGVVWMDKKPVNVVASNESLIEVDTTNRRQKDGTNARVTRPRVVTNYQENFRGVDISDQLRAKYSIGRPSKKWWKYLMNFIIDLCIVNSFIVKAETEVPQVARTKKRYRQLDFRINLSTQLIGNFARLRTPAPPMRPRATHAHLKLGRKRSTCKLCTKTGEKKRKTTQMGCEKCDKHLCSAECHNTFHVNIGIGVVTEE